MITMMALSYKVLGTISQLLNITAKANFAGIKNYWVSFLPHCSALSIFLCVGWKLITVTSVLQHFYEISVTQTVVL